MIFSRNYEFTSDEEKYITELEMSEQFHPRHRHPNSIISGVLFFNEDEEDELPPIKFHRTIDMFPLGFAYDELNEFNAGSRWFKPVQGRLILFPSLLGHDVETNKSSKVRTTLSFNTFVRGVIGNSSQLSEVKLS